MAESTLAELMDLKEVGRYLRISYTTLLRWAQNGTIPASKLGDVWRVRRSDLEAWIDEQRVGGGSANKGN